MLKKIMLIFSFFLVADAIAGQSFPSANYLPLVEKQEKQITIKIKPLKQHESFFIYYRTEGMKSFQIRKMKTDPDGMVSHRILTENLYGKNIEYFIVEKKANAPEAISLTHTIANFTQKESPEIYFQNNETSPAPSPVREAFIKINGSLSTATKVSDNSENPGQNYSANGNLRIYKNINDNDSQFDFDTNFTHTDPRNAGIESRINLSSMMIRFKKGEMQFEIGDVAVNETELTTSFLNRRGLRFELYGKTLYLNSFYTNSQQKTGFDGFGIPAANAGIFGVVAGINVKSALKLRGMFMTGKDNLDSKTVAIASNENPFREGGMFSLWGEINMLNNRLQLLGEISSSHFGSAQEKESLQKEKDTAWQAAVKFNPGILAISADYRKIGDRFNSIANLFLQNDREGLNSNIGLNIRSFSWVINYMDQKNYLHSLVQDMLHEKKIGTTFNWGIGSHFRIGCDVSRDNLDYDATTGLPTSTSDMNTYNYSASLGFMTDSNGINISVGKTESVNFTSNINGSLGLNLRFGQFMSLNPTLSYQSNKNLWDDSTSTIYNLYLNSEITFIPQYFTLTISASYMSNKNLNDTSTNWSMAGNLNFFMVPLFKNSIHPSISLKSQFQGTKYGSIETNNAIFMLQADISF